MIVEQRPDARKGMDHLHPLELAHTKPVDGTKQIGNFLFTRHHTIGFAVVGDVRRPDQAEIILIGIDENHPAVVILKQIGLRSLPELRHHDVAALDQANAMAAVQPGILADHALDPWPGGIDDRARRDLDDRPGLIPQFGAPGAVVPSGGDQCGSRENPRAAGRRIQRVEHDQPRVIDPAIRVFEAGAEFRLESLASNLARQI